MNKDFRIEVTQMIRYEALVQAASLEEAKNQLANDLEEGLAESDLHEVGNGPYQIVQHEETKAPS